MATHHALANIDIVDEVFQWFDYELTHGYPLEQTSDFVAGESAGEDVEIERRRSLASAARTCKSFHEPALRVLWRQLESLIPFFSLLPSFTKVQENVEQPFSSWHPRDIYHLPDYVSSHERERLRKYADFVRILYLATPAPTRTQDFTPESWSSMRTLFGDQPIFPNVHILHWSVVSPRTEFPGMMHFVSPTLQQILLNCCYWGSYMDARMPDLRASTWVPLLSSTTAEICLKASRLSQLTVCMGELDASEFITVLSHSHPSTLRGLTVFGPHHLPHINISGFMGLARIVSLERLTLSVVIDHQPGASIPPLDLPNLLEFRIPYCPAPAHMVPYDTITSARLKVLDISKLDYIGMPVLRRVCSGWARAFPALEVLSFRLTGTVWDQPLHTETQPLLSALEPLLTLRQMRSFTLSCVDVPVTVGDAELTAFSEAWPSLVELQVYNMSIPDNSRGSIAGLPGLLSLATNCPMLAALGIGRIVLFPRDLSMLPTGRFDHRLKTLRVRDGLAPDAYHLIRDKLFPVINMRLHKAVWEDEERYRCPP
ncbi:hypothetical protein C8Q70DRAFT_335619 [Cubamyces menziesii]|nr:hypothetical protein C8Q70DRAFT_335619 [Cubamyces menziesii]